MKSLKTEIILAATPEQIWQTLIDFNRYKNWNPFIVDSKGEAKAGNRLENTIRLKNKEQKFTPKLTQVKPKEYLEWVGHLWVPGLFDGRHYFKIETLEDGKCKLIHGEHFSGILSGLIFKLIKEDTLEGFKRMNEALNALLNCPSFHFKNKL
jgi:hypothetical protein